MKTKSQMKEPANFFSLKQVLAKETKTIRQGMAFEGGHRDAELYLRFSLACLQHWQSPQSSHH